MDNYLYSEEWLAPEWDKCGKCNDWKNYVPQELREEWTNFTPWQKYLIANTLQGNVAEYEEWE